jgi:hypothetical protein
MIFFPPSAINTQLNWLVWFSPPFIGFCAFVRTHLFPSLCFFSVCVFEAFVFAPPNVLIYFGSAIFFWTFGFIQTKTTGSREVETHKRLFGNSVVASPRNQPRNLIFKFIPWMLTTMMLLGM